MENTKIDWCDSSWNPITGCYHKCPYCYARGITNRFASRKGFRLVEPGTLILDEFVDDKPTLIEMYKQAFFYCGDTEEKYMCAYPHGFTPTLHRYRLNEYKDKQKPRNIFVGSMADAFGEWIPDRWIMEVFEHCKAAPQHNYLFLTKNPKRYIELETNKLLPWADNFWFGSSVTKLSDTYTWFTEKKFHWFLSVEPLLEDLGEMDADSVKPEWIIIGAETGNRKDKVVPKLEWIENLVNECRKYGIPVFMKSSLEGIYDKPLLREFPPQLTKK